MEINKSESFVEGLEFADKIDVPGYLSGYDQSFYIDSNVLPYLYINSSKIRLLRRYKFKREVRKFVTALLESLTADEITPMECFVKDRSAIVYKNVVRRYCKDEAQNIMTKIEVANNT